MRSFITVLAGLLAIGVLGYLCTGHHQPVFEADLSAKTVAALNNTAVKVTPLGQIMTLEGEVPDEATKRRMGELAAGVYGVAEVRNLLVVKPGGMTVEERKAAVNCQALFEDLLKQNINFQTGRAAIAASSYPLLNKLAEVAGTCPAAQIEVGGHTDPRGGLEMNMKLSRDRAAAVVAYLGQHGIDEKRLTAVGYGPNKPIAENNTRAGMAKNRRTEFKVKGI